MRKLLLSMIVVAVASTLAELPLCQATEVVLDPIADAWIRQYAPTGNYDADFISVWAGTTDPTDGENARYGVLSFDLSGITAPIVSARLELYAVNSWVNRLYPCRQDAFLVTPAVTDDSTVTWNSYQGSNPAEAQLEGLGVYNLPAGYTLDQRYSSTATAADVALLEAQRTGGTATFVFKAQDELWHTEEVTETFGRRDWADGDTAGEAPTITINGTAITADVDTWVREISPTTAAYDHDDVSVWYRERAQDPEGRRVGILEFDLSDITEEITSASMSLFSKLNSTYGEAFIQNATLLDTQSAPATWNDYAALTGTAFEDFGYYDLPMNAPTEQYLESDAASAFDLALLEAIRNGSDKLIIALEATGQEVTYEQSVFDEPVGSVDWSDSESTWMGYGAAPASNPDMWPRLIIETAEVPEPSTLVLLVIGIVTLAAVRRK